MFLSHTENAHKDRQEEHQPHASIITSFNETKLGPSTSESCDKERLSSSERTTLLRCVVIS